MEENIKIDLDLNLEHMLIGAERYALGRRTYIVQTTVDFILNIISKLSYWCICVIKTDIESQIIVSRNANKPELLGDEIDRKQWYKLIDAINEEIEKRGKTEWKR